MKPKIFLEVVVREIVDEAARKHDSIIYAKEYRKSFIEDAIKKIKEAA